MKTVINCDDVFDVLTRQPFPSGDAMADADVELHLSACHECRCLAEALRPAVGLIHESLQAEDQETLPSYRGCMEAILHDRHATLLPSHEPTPRSRPRMVKTFVSGGMIGVAAAIVVWLAVSNLSTDRSRSRVAGLNQAVVRLDSMQRELSGFGVPDKLGLETLISLGLSQSCFSRDRVEVSPAKAQPFPGANPAITADMRDFVCCTLCHSAGSELARDRSIRKVTFACAACHKTPPPESFGAVLSYYWPTA